MSEGSIDVVNTSSFDDSDDSSEFDKMIQQFFNIEDEEGFTKTDLTLKEVRSLAKLNWFSKKPTPLLNRITSENININEIQDFITDYIKMKVSIDRKGRKEGTQIATNYDKKDKEDEPKNVAELLNSFAQ